MGKKKSFFHYLSVLFLKVYKHSNLPFVNAAEPMRIAINTIRKNIVYAESNKSKQYLINSHACVLVNLIIDFRDEFVLAKNQTLVTWSCARIKSNT